MKSRPWAIRPQPLNQRDEEDFTWCGERPREPKRKTTNDETIMTKEFSNARMPNLQLGNSSFFGHLDLRISHFARWGSYPTN
jgi:hypothetical protein